LDFFADLVFLFLGGIFSGLFLFCGSEKKKMDFLGYAYSYLGVFVFGNEYFFWTGRIL
jgi:hypothetical protein